VLPGTYFLLQLLLLLLLLTFWKVTPTDGNEKFVRFKER
jgi:hypothetical protein